MTSTAKASPGLASFEVGHIAQQAGKVTEAMVGYRAAIRRDPGLAPAHFNLAQLYRMQGQHALAVVHFAQATRLRPAAPDGWLNLGVSQDQLGDLTAAAVSYRRAIELDRELAAAHFSLGNVLKQQGDLTGAVDAYSEAARLAPAAPEVAMNLGNTLRELGRPNEAVVALDRVVALRPDWPPAHWNLSLALLAAGRLSEGWAEYDWRWRYLELDPTRGFAWPRWQGESLSGKRLLVWREQGLGDELMFATLIPDLVGQGADVTLSVDPRLVTMLARAFPSASVVPDGRPGDRAGERYDYHLPLGSLPRYLRHTRGDFPSTRIFGTPERIRRVTWMERLAPLPDGLKVGISWRSGHRTADRLRFYAALAEWGPLFAVQGVTWINLQYDDCEAEIREIEAAAGIVINRWVESDLRDDLESVAALVDQLDLVITAPTAVSSIAGFVGTETWELDSGNDWTGHGEVRSPWLPAVRVFSRNAWGGTWSGLFAGVAAELKTRAGLEQVNRSRTVTG
ncbi:MAG: tetratricopeptide repeat protein [Gemmatimonadota bacterium]